MMHRSKYYLSLASFLSLSYVSQAQAIDTVHVTGYREFDPFGHAYGVTDENAGQRYQALESAYAAQRGYEEYMKRKAFCRDAPGQIALGKSKCEKNATDRDIARQASCIDISLSYKGIGWTNNCRLDSTNVKSSDYIQCAIDAQVLNNNYNSICNN